VVLGKPLGFEDAFSWVAIDDEKAAYTVVSYLAGKAGGDIGTVTGPMHASSGRERLAGYQRAIGDKSRPDLVAAGDWSLRSGRLGAERCSAVIQGCGGCSSPPT
jgi:DNA-binding LacI/PurR family transcriptional regulator